ncbi:bifunctional DNA primase/polymerase [Streptomyces sp. PTM05]|uniref:Bifunctional DNA primase/polymerase n=1 Tax=Streptantibioticus parmotrematis TaxID=2873249 RepID=A0ABS7QZZ6_9ACTN|nr:bifunctional DNA primase/polymerase [Streptantibioticus parmotrematis]MBY8888792.1 bifunctional DNA primase/polymerase [Streptantibioticus parmotrematis]
MGFTIGSFREIRDIAPGTRRRTRTSVRATVAEYTGRYGWMVAPGARAVRGECSCGDPRCTAPGAHPLRFASEISAGLSPARVAEAWDETPGAAVLLPAGRSFDALDVAEEAGCQAMVRLERMGLRLGPVLATPTGRAQFFVAPGAAAALPSLLYRMGWDDTGLDLRCLGRGDYVTAPPSDLGGLGPVRWLRPPSPDRQPPEARLLLGTLAYVCHRHGLLVRS